MPIISDRTARQVAAAWYDGRALYDLVSTGTITVDTVPAIHHCLTMARTETDRRALNALLAYVRHHGERGPQPGWSSLGW